MYVFKKLKIELPYDPAIPFLGIYPKKPETLTRKDKCGTSLVAQWVRLHTPNAGGPGSIHGWGTRSHMHAATKSLHATTKIPCATTKTQHSQNNK